MMSQSMLARWLAMMETKSLVHLVMRQGAQYLGVAQDYQNGQMLLQTPMTLQTQMQADRSGQVSISAIAIPDPLLLERHFNGDDVTDLIEVDSMISHPGYRALRETFLQHEEATRLARAGLVSGNVSRLQPKT